MRKLVAIVAASLALATSGSAVAQTGQALYQQWCQGCHGADAGGHPLAATDPRFRLYPSLRGQHAAYVAQRLKDFRDGKHVLTSNDRIMHGVARGLSDADAQAIADWVQGSKP